MKISEFQQSIAYRQQPMTLTPPLSALWLDAAGDWDAAHRAVQSDPSIEAAWVHAYLHRKEGDSANAGYWYRRADRRPVTGPLPEEWEQITTTLLGANGRD